MDDSRKAYVVAQDLHNAIMQRDAITISEITGRYVSGYREKIALAFMEQYNVLLRTFSRSGGPDILNPL